jgi:hypothetical protein
LKEEAKSKLITQVVGKLHMEPEFLTIFKDNPAAAVKNVGKEMGEKVKPEESKEIAAKVEAVLPLPFLAHKKVEKLIDDVKNRADKGYEKVQHMSGVLFWWGIAILTAMFVLDVYILVAQVNWANFVLNSGVLGGVGAVTIYSSTNYLPDKVKNSVADLVQINVAFFSFLDQLSILMGVKEKEDINGAINVAEEINKVTENVMKQIQVYCEVTIPSPATPPEKSSQKPAPTPPA